MPDKTLLHTSNGWRQAAAAAGAPAPVERTWRNSRSLDELKIHLVEGIKLNPTEEEVENLRRLFLYAAPRPNLQSIFTEMATEMWEIAGDTAWMADIVHSMPADTIVWHDMETFLAGSKKLSAKKLPFWFDLTREARGRDWIVGMTLHMPSRYWTSIEAALAKHDGEVEYLFETTLDWLRKGDASADAVVWLWKRKDERTADAFSNPQAIFRILGIEVKGEYIKARKDLLKLLMEKVDFQLALMNGGTPEGIATFIKAVKHLPLLNRGEQASLLVKVVRQFPDAKELVEEKRGETPRRHMPKLTSKRTFQQAQSELRDLINKKIPENMQQISHARDYGDLRENFEFKAAKDAQRQLMARRAELERSLQEVRPTDFTGLEIGETVIPGSTVGLTLESGKSETYHVLGLWDSVPDRKILSYDTPLGKVLMGKSVGDTIVAPQGYTATIASISELPNAVRQWARGVDD